MAQRDTEGLVLVERDVSRTRHGKVETFTGKFWVKPDALRPADRPITDPDKIAEHVARTQKDREWWANNRKKRKEEGVAKKPKDPPPPLPEPAPPVQPKVDRGQYAHAEEAPKGSFDLPRSYSPEKVVEPKFLDKTLLTSLTSVARTSVATRLVPAYETSAEKDMTADVGHLSKWLQKTYPELKNQATIDALSDSQLGDLQQRIWKDIDDPDKFEGMPTSNNGSGLYVTARTRVARTMSAIWFSKNEELRQALQTAQLKLAPTATTNGVGQMSGFTSLRSFPERSLSCAGIKYDNGPLALSSKSCNQLRRAFMYGVNPTSTVEKDSDNEHGVSILLHEMLHASSHRDYKYEGAGKNAPFANLEEATTEFLARSRMVDFADSFKIPLKDKEGLEGTSRLILSKPYFTAVPLTLSQDGTPKWETATPGPSTYAGQVRRFAVIAAYAEGAKTTKDAVEAADRWAAAVKQTRGTLRYARIARRSRQ